MLIKFWFFIGFDSFGNLTVIENDKDLNNDDHISLKLAENNSFIQCVKCRNPNKNHEKCCQIWGHLFIEPDTGDNLNVLTQEIDAGNFVDNNNHKKCPQCTVNCEERLNFRPVCDYRFETLKVQIEISKIDAEYDDKLSLQKCSSCKQLNKSDLQFCKYCGKNMLLKAKIYEEKMKGENNENKKNIQNLFRSEITRKPKMNIYYFMDLIIRALNWIYLKIWF